MQVEIVKKPLRYDGRTYQTGESVEMVDSHARLFITLGNAKKAEGAQAEEESHGRSKRRYRRRDMQAE